MTFSNLFTPFSINGVTLRNRIAISGHFAGWWVEGGMPGPDLHVKGSYERR